MNGPSVLVVDNYDSFVFTLVGYLTELGADVRFVEADAIDDAALAISGVDAVMISPGPGTPTQAGASIAVVHAAAEARLPLLGVCLGHQAIAEAFGAVVERAPEPMHGRTSALDHDADGLFTGVAPAIAVGRYHSLAVVEETLPDALVVTARAGDVVMAIRHAELPIVGVQFHPESVLTDAGYLMLANWLDSIRDTGAVMRARALDPRVRHALTARATESSAHHRNN